MYLDLYTHFMNQFTLVHKHYIYTFGSEGNGFLLFSSHYNFIFRTIGLFYPYYFYFYFRCFCQGSPSLWVTVIQGASCGVLELI